MWYIHIREYYSAIKRNDILTHATAWMTLDNIMLTERSQTLTVTCFMISFI